MSATFRAAARALADDPALHAKVVSASTSEERTAHFKDAGIEVPTHADVNSHVADMAGVAGGTGGFYSSPTSIAAAAGASSASS